MNLLTKPRVIIFGKQNGKWKKENKRLRIGTWNVRTLLKPGALKNITDELNTYSLPVVALQEVRWSGIGIVKSANSTLFYSGSGCEKHERRFPNTRTNVTKHKEIFPHK